MIKKILRMLIIDTLICIILLYQIHNKELSKQNEHYNSIINEFNQLSKENEEYTKLIEESDIIEKNNKELKEEEEKNYKEIQRLNDEINIITNNIKKIS